MKQYILHLPSYAFFLWCTTPKPMYFSYNKHIGNLNVNILFPNLFSSRRRKVLTNSISHHRIQLRLTAILRNKMYTEHNLLI